MEDDGTAYCEDDITPAMRGTTLNGKKQRRYSGGWKNQVETKLSQCIGIGVGSSGKDETRRYREEFFLGKLAMARMEGHYYEEMLRLERDMAEVRGRAEASLTGKDVGKEGNEVVVEGRPEFVGRERRER